MVPNNLRPQHAARQRQKQLQWYLGTRQLWNPSTWHSSTDEEKCLGTQRSLSPHHTRWNANEARCHPTRENASAVVTRGHPGNELMTSTEVHTTCKQWEPPEERNSSGQTKGSPAVKPTGFEARPWGHVHRSRWHSREGGWQAGWSRQGGTWRHQPTRESVWLACRHPYKVTQPMQEGGWSETSGWVTRVGFLQLFYRQEDAERKNAAVGLSQCHTSQYHYPNLSIRHTQIT